MPIAAIVGTGLGPLISNHPVAQTRANEHMGHRDFAMSGSQAQARGGNLIPNLLQSLQKSTHRLTRL
jgi:hypothetical protein